MPSFGEGFANALSGQIAQNTEAKRQSMLELMMLSKKIELEQQSKMAEMQQAHEYNMVPEESYRPLASAAGLNIPEGTGPMSQNLLESLFQGNSRAMMAGVMQGRLNLEQQKAQQSTSPVYDPQFGIQIGERAQNAAGGKSTTKPLPGANQKLEEARELYNMLPMYNQFKQAANGINFGRVGGLLSRGEAALGMNPDVTNFNNLKTNMVTMQPALMANFRRFNDPEYQRLANEISLTSTPQEVQDWMHNMDNLVYSKHTGLGIGADPTWKDPLQGQMSQQDQQHFSNGFNAGANAATNGAKTQYLQSLQAQFGSQQNGKSK